MRAHSVCSSTTRHCQHCRRRQRHVTSQRQSQHCYRRLHTTSTRQQSRDTSRQQSRDTYRQPSRHIYWRHDRCHNDSSMTWSHQSVYGDTDTTARDKTVSMRRCSLFHVTSVFTGRVVTAKLNVSLNRT